MKMSKTAKVWIDYHTTHSKKILSDPIGPSSSCSARNSVMPKLIK